MSSATFKHPAKYPKGRTAFINARLLDPESGLDETGALLVEDGRIADIGAHLFNDGQTPDDAEIIDCGGHLLAPGLIDMQVHLREPGMEKKETIESGTMAAAAGGITTLVAQPYTAPVVDDATMVYFLHQRAREKSYVNVHTYGAITKGLQGKQLAEMGLMAEAGAVGFTDGDNSIANSQLMRRAMATASMLEHPLIHHAQDHQLAGGGCMHEGSISTQLGVPGIPSLAESTIIQRDIALQSLTGCHYHAAHISTKEAVQAVREAKARGQQVTCAVSTHHLTLTDDAMQGFTTNAKTSPPLRSEEDRQALLKGLRDGTIDAIVSDHSPHERESKDVPLTSATSGMVGLETLLPLALRLTGQSGIPLTTLFKALTCNPADILGLQGGRLQKTRPADLTLINLDSEWKLEHDTSHSKSHNTHFMGQTMKGRALRTVVCGRSIYCRPSRSRCHRGRAGGEGAACRDYGVKSALTLPLSPNIFTREREQKKHPLTSEPL